MALPSSLTTRELADEFFIENRNRLLEIAAFLDRLDRSDPSRSSRDFRLQALTEAIGILAGGGPDYVRTIQTLLSDPTTEPIAALDRKSAQGAYEGGKRG
jgi:hypothetical protein